LKSLHRWRENTIKAHKVLEVNRYCRRPTLAFTHLILETGNSFWNLRCKSFSGKCFFDELSSILLIPPLFILSKINSLVYRHNINK
jgi:mannose-1-phosphate guanylyltransferase